MLRYACSSRIDQGLGSLSVILGCIVGGDRLLLLTPMRVPRQNIGNKMMDNFALDTYFQFMC